MSFDKSMNFVFEQEGVLSNNKNDKGLLTKYGISQRAYPDLDISNLTKEQASEIYKRDYWDMMQCSALPDTVAHLVFDCGVNSGCYASIKMLQQALNKLGANLVVDSKIGPKTIQCANKYAASDICDELLDIRTIRYVDIVVDYNNQLMFLRGWINRIIANRKFLKEF